jgi:hypothetical protein
MELNTTIIIHFENRMETWTVAELLEEYPSFGIASIVYDVLDGIDGAEYVEFDGITCPKHVSGVDR